MQSIFLVQACIHYEGSQQVRAFDNKGDADAFAEVCREYQKTRPEWPSSDATESDIDAWRVAHKAWEAAHPGGDVGSTDYYDTIEVPFGPVQTEEGQNNG
jgi:hypothetical protein